MALCLHRNPQTICGNLAKGGDVNVDSRRSDCCYQLVFNSLWTWLRNRMQSRKKITATEARTPKADLVKEMAQIFDVSTRAINVPNIDSYLGLMHTLFPLEDMYGIKIGEIDGELCLRLDRKHKEYQHLFEPFHAWQQMAAKLEAGEISQEEYDNWRYNYPELDTFEIRAKVPSLELSDELIKALKKENQ